jgi:hypothetical protein
MARIAYPRQRVFCFGLRTSGFWLISVRPEPPLGGWGWAKQERIAYPRQRVFCFGLRTSGFWLISVRTEPPLGGWGWAKQERIAYPRQRVFLSTVIVHWSSGFGPRTSSFGHFRASVCSCHRSPVKGLLASDFGFQASAIPHQPGFKICSLVFADIDPFGRFDIKCDQQTIVEPDRYVLYTLPRNYKLFVCPDEIRRI